MGRVALAQDSWPQAVACGSILDGRTRQRIGKVPTLLWSTPDWVVGLPSAPQIWARSRLPTHDASLKKALRTLTIKKTRESFEGAIRIPSRASSFLFNDLEFLRIPRKSLQFLASLFSIPTTPASSLSLSNGLANSLRHCGFFPGARDSLRIAGHKPV